MESRRSFPSGHVFGSTVLFGFWGFLAVYYGVKRTVLLPVLGAPLFMILSVSFARIHVQAHWPSDAAGGYLLGSLWLLILIPFFLCVQRMSWPSVLSQFQDLTVESCEGCWVEKSIASRVVLNPDQGTAIKTYRPPPVVRLLYWMAFQARFPYESNPKALHAAVCRSKIASLLTIHIFGKDLVAHVTSESCNHGKCSFVTEFIPGEKVGNDEEAGEYLGQASKTFAKAGYRYSKRTRGIPMLTPT